MYAIKRRLPPKIIADSGLPSNRKKYNATREPGKYKSPILLFLLSF
jgi:hypothetical protein